MSLPFRPVVIGGMLALALSTVGVAAQTARTETTAEVRLAWAKRHVELVCRPFEAKQMFDRATRCYNDVARLVADTSKPLPTATAERVDAAPRPAAAPAARPAAPATIRPATSRPIVRTAAKRSPARARILARPVISPTVEVPPLALLQDAAPSRRCSGVACLKYTLLGVGF